MHNQLAVHSHILYITYYNRYDNMPYTYLSHYSLCRLRIPNVTVSFGYHNIHRWSRNQARVSDRCEAFVWQDWRKWMSLWASKRATVSLLPYLALPDASRPSSYEYLPFSTVVRSTNPNFLVQTDPRCLGHRRVEYSCCVNKCKQETDQWKWRFCLFTTIS